MIGAQAVHARLGPRGDQTIEVIIDHGYHPQAIVARAGMPLRVVFRRRDTDDCTDRVIFSSPHIDRRLARGSATTIVLPAQPAGEVRFTCGMGRYHGQIELRAEGSSSATSILLAARRGIGRALASARAREQRTVADMGRALLEVQLARGSITQSEFDRALALPRRHDMGETTVTTGQSPDSARAERRAAVLERRRSERRHRSSSDFQARERRQKRLRAAGFGMVVVAVLGAGIYLAAGDLFGQRGSASTAEAIPVRLSMAGFTPGEVRVPAGKTVALELWTTDAAPHLHNGVHTMISDELGIYEELPAAGATGESRRVVEITAPAKPGTYDIYCNTCCGGKDSPTMHAKLIVEA